SDAYRVHPRCLASANPNGCVNGRLDFTSEEDGIAAHMLTDGPGKFEGVQSPFVGFLLSHHFALLHFASCRVVALLNHVASAYALCVKRIVVPVEPLSSGEKSQVLFLAE